MKNKVSLTTNYPKQTDTMEGKEEITKGDYLKYHWMIIRRPVGWYCAYIKLWKKHPLEIVLDTEGYDGCDVDCHGGLTFGGKRKDKVFSSGYWIGWDYAHVGDYTAYHHPHLGLDDDKRWTFDEVLFEVHEVIDQLTEKYL